MNEKKTTTNKIVWCTPPNTHHLFVLFELIVLCVCVFPIVIRNLIWFFTISSNKTLINSVYFCLFYFFSTLSMFNVKRYLIDINRKKKNVDMCKMQQIMLPPIHRTHIFNANEQQLQCMCSSAGKSSDSLQCYAFNEKKMK